VGQQGLAATCSIFQPPMATLGKWAVASQTTIEMSLGDVIQLLARHIWPIKWDAVFNHPVDAPLLIEFLFCHQVPYPNSGSFSFIALPHIDADSSQLLHIAWQKAPLTVHEDVLCNRIRAF